MSKKKVVEQIGGIFIFLINAQHFNLSSRYIGKITIREGTKFSGIITDSINTVDVSGCYKNDSGFILMNKIIKIKITRILSIPKSVPVPDNIFIFSGKYGRSNDNPKKYTQGASVISFIESVVR